MRGGKGKHFLAIQPEFRETPWYMGKDLNNREVRTLNRLMTGHNYSKFWLAKMRIEDDDECEICQEIETAEHIVLHCNKYTTIRSKYSFDCKFRTLIELFKSNDIKTFKEVVHFLYQIDKDI